MFILHIILCGICGLVVLRRSCHVMWSFAVLLLPVKPLFVAFKCRLQLFLTYLRLSRVCGKCNAFLEKANVEFLMKIRQRFFIFRENFLQKAICQFWKFPLKSTNDFIFVKSPLNAISFKSNLQMNRHICDLTIDFGYSLCSYYPCCVYYY